MCAFPLSVSSKIANPLLKLADKIVDTLKCPPKKSSKSWNYVLWTIKDIIKESQLPVYRPHFFCPVPAWMPQGKCYSLQHPSRFDGTTSIYGHVLPKMTDIFNSSYAVQHFFESAFQNATTVSDDFWLKIFVQCLLGREAYRVVGSNWKIILDQFSKELSESKK